jgi:hypothetical protein
MNDPTRTGQPCVQSVATPAASAKQGVAPPIPVEVQKVVDAFVGEWVFELTLKLPGAHQPKVARTRFSGKKVAGGYAVACIGQGEMEELGRYEEVALVSYDMGNQTVRFMNTTSLGHVNDFSGTWTSDRTIAFAPLQTWRMGKPAVVNWSIRWTDENNMTFSQVTRLEDGTISTVDAVATRQPAPDREPPLPAP